MQQVLVKAWLIGLGLGMLILCIVGIAMNAGTEWLTWLDFAAAVASVYLSASMKPLAIKRVLYAGVVALSLGVFALGVTGIVLSAPSVLIGWNFAFAAAFLFVGIAALLKKGEDTTARNSGRRWAA